MLPFSVFFILESQWCYFLFSPCCLSLTSLWLLPPRVGRSGSCSALTSVSLLYCSRDHVHTDRPGATEATEGATLPPLPCPPLPLSLPSSPTPSPPCSSSPRRMTLSSTFRMTSAAPVQGQRLPSPQSALPSILTHYRKWLCYLLPPPSLPLCLHPPRLSYILQRSSLFAYRLPQT